MSQAGESNSPNSALRKVREEQGLTQKYVAKRLGVHIDTYRRWEQNAQQPSVKHIGQLCQLFKKSVEELGYPHFFD
jgi:transcriptional regulator with XRE-family HTH domain